MNIAQQLFEKFRSALAELGTILDQSGRGGSLVSIGLVTDDAVESIGASLLFVGDLPDNAPSYQRLSPVEWPHTHEAAFTELNRYLKAIRPPAGESDDEYKARVDLVVDACAAAMLQVDLRRRFPQLAFISFAGVDPNPVLEAAEAEIVRRLNSPHVLEEWRREFG